MNTIIYDDNNPEDAYFYGSQESKTKAGANHSIQELFSEGILTAEEKNNAIKQVADGAKDILLKNLVGNRKMTLHIQPPTS